MIFTSALTAISEFMRGAYGFLLIVVLLFPVMGSTLLQMTVEQDEKAEFDRIQLTYPLSKSEIVLSKYLGGLIVQGGMTLYSFVFVLIYVYGYRTITLEDALPTWGIGVVGGVIYFAVSYVAYFWLGNLKGVTFYISCDGRTCNCDFCSACLISGWRKSCRWKKVFGSLVVW